MRGPGLPFGYGAGFSFAGGLGVFLVFQAIVARGKDVNASDAYALMPLFALMGVLCAILYRVLERPLGFPSGGLGFVMGCLAGGAAAGMLALWLAADDRPLVNRAVISLFGGAMLGGFFPWIGALLMHASRKPEHSSTS